MNMAERETILYSALTGVSFCSSFKHFSNTHNINNTAVRDVTRATHSVVHSGRYFIVLITVIIEQAIESSLLHV